MGSISNEDVAANAIAEGFGWRSLGPVNNYAIESDGLLLDCGEAQVRITPERRGIIRVRLAPTGVFGRDHSWAVVAAREDDGPGPWRVEENGDAIFLHAESASVRIQRSPCRIGFLAADGGLICADDPSKGMAWDNGEVRCWKSLNDDDHFFGLGERGCPMDKRGQVLVDWNHDAAEHDSWTDPLYQSHPFCLVVNKGHAHGIFFDNTWRATFDLGKTSIRDYSFGAPGGEMDYYFLPGPAPRDVVSRYAALVGATPLPPLWSLGYQQCRWSYETAKRVRWIARRLRKNRLPCDTIYIDIDYMDAFRCFTWDRERFPNPPRLMKELASLGYKVVLIVDPGIKHDPGYFVYDEGVVGDHFCRDGSGKPYVGKVWPGESVYPDFTRPETREWWGGLYKGYVQDGVTGFWNDMNEPADFTFSHGTVPLTLRHDNDGVPTDHREAHNVYGMQMARATFEGLRRLKPADRPFVLTRAGYSGVQRYAAVWTGDNLSSWEHLRMSIPMLLNMGLSGLSFSGADIGGFRAYPSAELYTRWLQLGIFYPLCRTHTCGGLKKDGEEQDPASFGKKHLRINRAAIELRYRLLPYIYSQMRDGERTGLPLMRPILLDYPDHADAHRVQHEFLFGNALFVAPVVYEAAAARLLRLPVGTWYDYFTGCRFDGGEEFSLPVRLSSIPLFARAGSVIPSRDVVQYTDERPVESLILDIFPGDGGGHYYNDDGRTYAYREGDYLEERYVSRLDEERFTLRLVSREGDERFAPPAYLLRFRGVCRAPVQIAARGDMLPRLVEKKRARMRTEGWWFDKRDRSLCVRLCAWREGDAVVATFASPADIAI